jgi:hypothetical protein
MDPRVLRVHDDEPDNLLTELLYCVSSFHAIFTPVSITMILSALAVVNINTEETRAQGEAAYSQTYEVFDLEDGNSSQNFAASVGNVFIMVSVICAMTFVIVVLYKYGCMKIFLGYMVVVTAMLLGYFTANMALVAIQKYNIHFDKFSFAYLIWNYAIVGVLAIFYNKGIPKFVTQGYLVTSSVVLAWQLSYFNDWTAWTLLVMLALYDLFAVLSPCGPLKALTQLMSRPGARPLPGLLYEASLPEGVQRPSRATATTARSSDREDAEDEPASQPSQQQASTTTAATIPTSSRRQQNDDATVASSVNSTQFFTADSERTISTSTQQQREDQTSHDAAQVTTTAGISSLAMVDDDDDDQTNHDSPQVMTTVGTSFDQSPSRRGKIALALAKLYKLPVIDTEGALRRRSRRELPEQREYSPEEIHEMGELTPKQLKAEVTVVFPHRGGRIVLADNQDSNEGKKYLVYNRSEELLRTFVVNKKGKVMQVVRREAQDTPTEHNTIKLGLVRHSSMILCLF